MWNNLHFFAILCIVKPMEKLRHKRPCPCVCFSYPQDINFLHRQDDERNIRKIVIKGVPRNN